MGFLDSEMVQPSIIKMKMEGRKEGRKEGQHPTTESSGIFPKNNKEIIKNLKKI